MAQHFDSTYVTCYFYLSLLKILDSVPQTFAHEGGGGTTEVQNLSTKHSFMMTVRAILRYKDKVYMKNMTLVSFIPVIQAGNRVHMLSISGPFYP